MIARSTSRPAPAPAHRRLAGIDLARALAFGGMLLAHFAVSTRAADPGWLRLVDDAADGRAAPLFCVLLGLGAGLLATRAAADAVLARRGVALFAVGVAIWPLVDWVYVILPEYGVLLAALPLMRRLRTPLLLPAAAAAFLAPSLVVWSLGATGLRSTAQPTSYADLLEVGDLARYLLWTGGYPVIGWAGFVLVGLWVSRRRLHDAATQWRLLVGAGAVAATQPLIDVLATTGLGEQLPFLDASAHSNQTAWYVLASATAVAAVAGCLLVARRPLAPLQALAHLGQLALTAYLAHLALGELLLWGWIERARPPLVVQVALVAVIFAAFAAAATAWRRHRPRGPAEGLLRALSG